MVNPVAQWARAAQRRRAQRALERQLEYQEARALAGSVDYDSVSRAMAAHSKQVRVELERFGKIPADAAVLEVGSGSEGLIFFFGAGDAVGVDPLAEYYARLLPWHQRVPTIAAHGEELPFEDNSFDIVLCDNVVDHAEDPAQIMREMARVLKPRGLLYFTVNVHHPFWKAAARVYALWRGMGLPGEVTPFADHTVHLTLSDARALVKAGGFRTLYETEDTATAIHMARTAGMRHLGDLPKRIFFKNAKYEVIAERD